MCGKLSRLTNKVSTHCDLEPIGVVLLGPVVTHITGICDGTVYRYVLHFIQKHEFYCIFNVFVPYP